MIHPATLRDDWNYPTQRLGRFLGIEDPSFYGVMEWLIGLCRTLGIPETLGAFGVPDDETARVAAAAIDPTAGTNPRPLDPGNLESLFLNCLRGTL